MTITANIIADSISKDKRVTTFVLEYPRFIHAELLTHRVFSKNSASSRAIPIDKMIQKVIDDPAIPVSWGKNQKGMSASENLTKFEEVEAIETWLRARDRAVVSARELQALGLHKQICNRTIEIFMNIKVILTGTEFENFFNLRCHKDAQPEIQVLAKAMREAYRSSVPHIAKNRHDWHLPFLTKEELENKTAENLSTNFIKSVARCARVSYDNVDSSASTFESDLRIFKQLGESAPAHLSPFEHQAFPESPSTAYFNLIGWKSLRWCLENDRELFKTILSDVEK